MSETVVIHYSPSQILSYAILNEKMAISSPPQQADVEAISILAKTRKVHVLMDAACVSIDTVKIPGNNRQRQLQAVPFALEDKLASDVEELHFVLGKKLADGSLPVITIAHSYMQQCLSFFKEADINIESINVDVLSLPLEKNSWTVLISEESALIKTADNNGFNCDLENLPLIIKASIKATDDELEKIICIQTSAEDAITDQLDDLDIEIVRRHYNEYPLEILAQQEQTVSKQMNLLQSRYKPQRKSTQLWKNWKSVAAIAGLYMILQLVSANIETQQLKEKNQQLTAQIEKAFKSANPGTRKYNNMRKRMQRRIKDLQTGKSKDANEVFLEILKDTAPALSKQKKINITALVYRNKRIDIELNADSLQTLETIKSQLSSLPKIKIVLSTSVEKDKVSGRLRLEKQG